MNHEITAVSHDLELGGSHRSMKELHAELSDVIRESGHDPSGLLGDLLFSMEMNANRTTRRGADESEVDHEEGI